MTETNIHFFTECEITQNFFEEVYNFIVSNYDFVTVLTPSASKLIFNNIHDKAENIANLLYLVA